MISYPIIYKKDSKGKIRQWNIEIEDNKYRSIAGLVDGEKVTSEWTIVEGKNIGRSNETSSIEQTMLEVRSLYKKKLDKDYHENIKDVDQAKIYKPMLATSWNKRKDKISFDQPVFLQPKLDGIRCIANASGLFSRAGKRITTCPHIEESLRPLFDEYSDLVLDGELYNHDLREDFNKIISIVRKTKLTNEDLDLARNYIQYHVYDLPSMSDKPFGKRFNELYSLVDHQYVQTVDTFEVYDPKDLDRMYAVCIEQGYEGGIIRLNEKYEQKRSNHLIKRKDFEDKEFEIVRIEEGSGNWAGMAKRVVFRLEDGRECGSGLKGTQEFARELLQRADSYIGGQVTVQYFTRTPDGVPRFPVAKALYKNRRSI